jgi:hypothetical protein
LHAPKTSYEVEILGFGGQSNDKTSVASVQFSNSDISGGKSGSSTQTLPDKCVDKKHQLRAYVVSKETVGDAELLSLSSGTVSFAKQCIAMQSSLFAVRPEGRDSAADVEEALNQYAPRERRLLSASDNTAPLSPPQGPGVFRRLMRSVKSLSFSHCKNDMFQLSAEDIMLLLLQIALCRLVIS